jgi:hypothetical protein
MPDAADITLAAVAVESSDANVKREDACADGGASAGWARVRDSEAADSCAASFAAPSVAGADVSSRSMSVPIEIGMWSGAGLTKELPVRQDWSVIPTALRDGSGQHGRLLVLQRHLLCDHDGIGVSG